MDNDALVAAIRRLLGFVDPQQHPISLCEAYLPAAVPDRQAGTTITASRPRLRR